MTVIVLTQVNVAVKPSAASYVEYEKADVQINWEDCINDMLSTTQVSAADILNEMAKYWNGSVAGPLLSADAKRMLIELLGETSRIQLEVLRERYGAQ